MKNYSVTGIAALSIAIAFTAGCSTRDLQSSLSGSTSQRLVSHSIDDVVLKLPEAEFSQLAGKRLYLDSHFIQKSELKDYAHQRLALELSNRWGAEVVSSPESADMALSVFFTSLGTDLDNFGITIPLTYIPAFDEGTSLNVITLEKFHGISELYYFLGPIGKQSRGDTIQAVVKTDALGLPFITIPLSNLDRAVD